MLKLPTIQNWSCHNCAGCCRQHAIEVTAEEKTRIEKQAWAGQEEFGAGQPVFVWHAGPVWKKRYRLAQRGDGACVFLDEKGLCRIHAKFGEAAKPLACRIYPYAFHPAGKDITVSLRFSCPSVVRNRGKTLEESRKDVQTLQRLVVPKGVDKLPPPAVHPGQSLPWPDFLRLVEALDETLEPAAVPIETKLLQALFWVQLVGQARFEKIRDERLDEFLGIVVNASRDEVLDEPSALGEPTRLARTQFRLLVAQYARRDTAVELRAGWAGRWKLFRSALRFASGKGSIPPLQEAFRAVPFAAVEQPFGGWPAEVDEILTRYFRVKVQGMHFCGRGYYNVPFVEGFQSLALIFPATLWLARWLAAGDDRQSLTTDDVARALAIADHHHGFSPAFGQATFRRRVRQLAATGDIARLIAWYSR